MFNATGWGSLTDRQRREASWRPPRRVHPWVVASACLPLGRGNHDALEAALRQMIAALAQDELREPLSTPRAGASWPAAGQTWIVAVGYDSGRRVAFGRREAPAASLPEAVVASCSIPGWFRPAVIGGRHYVDGGVRSPASADLLSKAGLAEVYVLARIASQHAFQLALAHAGAALDIPLPGLGVELLFRPACRAGMRTQTAPPA